MKKLLLAIMVIAFATETYAQQKDEISNAFKTQNMVTRKRITRSFEIGKKSLDCLNGFGFCFIKEETTETNLKYKSNEIISYGKNLIAVAVVKKSLSAEKIKENFSTNEVKMDEDFIFPKEITKALRPKTENPKDIIFKKGNHKIIETASYYIVL